MKVQNFLSFLCFGLEMSIYLMHGFELFKLYLFFSALVSDNCNEKMWYAPKYSWIIEFSETESGARFFTRNKSAFEMSDSWARQTKKRRDFFLTQVEFSLG